jgi:hypothetical protein
MVRKIVAFGKRAIGYHQILTACDAVHDSSTGTQVPWTTGAMRPTFVPERGHEGPVLMEVSQKVLRHVTGLRKATTRKRDRPVEVLP